MQDLCDALDKATGSPTPCDSESPYNFLREASVRWAKFCLYSLTGKALSQGMNIATAIAAFVNEVED
jgi:hypothetical protein